MRLFKKKPGILNNINKKDLIAKIQKELNSLYDEQGKNDYLSVEKARQIHDETEALNLCIEVLEGQNNKTFTDLKNYCGKAKQHPINYAVRHGGLFPKKSPAAFLVEKVFSYFEQKNPPSVLQIPLISQTN